MADMNFLYGIGAGFFGAWIPHALKTSREERDLLLYKLERFTTLAETYLVEKRDSIKEAVATAPDDGKVNFQKSPTVRELITVMVIYFPQFRKWYREIEDNLRGIYACDEMDLWHHTEYLDEASESLNELVFQESIIIRRRNFLTPYTRKTRGLYYRWKEWLDGWENY